MTRYDMVTQWIEQRYSKPKVEDAVQEDTISFMNNKRYHCCHKASTNSIKEFYAKINHY